MMKGIVILGHGSRATVDEANVLLLDMVAYFKEQTGEEMVVPAWMTTASRRPGLMAAAEELIAKNCEEIIIAPWFLTDGVHIREDIPRQISELKAKHPLIDFRLAKPLGADPRLVDILLDRIQEVS